MKIEHIIFYHPKNAACLVDYGNLSVLVDTSRSSKLDALDYEIKKKCAHFCFVFLIGAAGDFWRFSISRKMKKVAICNVEVPQRNYALS